MALKGKIVEKSKPGHPEEKLYYAVPDKTGYTFFHSFAYKVSLHTGVYKRTVSCVLIAAFELLKKEFEEGKTVELADLGDVRLSFGSNAKKTNKGFKASDINKKRVIFKLSTQMLELFENIEFEIEE